MDSAEAFFGADVITYQPSNDSGDCDYEENDEMQDVIKLESVWHVEQSDTDLVLPSVEAFTEKLHQQPSQYIHHRHHAQSESLTQKSEVLHSQHITTSATPSGNSPELISTSIIEEESDLNERSNPSLDLEKIIFYTQSESIAKTETVLELFSSEVNKSPSPESPPFNSATTEPPSEEKEKEKNSMSASFFEDTTIQRIESSPSSSGYDSVPVSPHGNQPSWMKNVKLRGSDDSCPDRIISLTELEISMEQTKREEEMLQKAKKDRSTKSAPCLSTISVHRSPETIPSMTTIESPTQQMLFSTKEEIMSPNSSKKFIKQHSNGVLPNVNFIPLTSLGEILKSRSRSPSPKANRQSIATQTTPKNTISRKATTGNITTTRTTSPSMKRHHSTGSQLTMSNVIRNSRTLSPAGVNRSITTKKELSEVTNLSTPAQRMTRATSPAVIAVNFISPPSVSSGTTAKEILSTVSSLSSSTSNHETTKAGEEENEPGRVLDLREGHSLDEGEEYHEHAHAHGLDLPKQQSIPTVNKPTLRSQQQPVNNRNGTTQGLTRQTRSSTGSTATGSHNRVKSTRSSGELMSNNSSSKIPTMTTRRSSFSGNSHSSSSGHHHSHVHRSVSNEDSEMWSASGRIRHHNVTTTGPISSSSSPQAPTTNTTTRTSIIASTKVATTKSSASIGIPTTRSATSRPWK